MRGHDLQVNMTMYFYFTAVNRSGQVGNFQFTNTIAKTVKQAGQFSDAFSADNKVIITIHRIPHDVRIQFSHLPNFEFISNLGCKLRTSEATRVDERVVVW